MNRKLILKILDLSHLVPIRPNCRPNLTSLVDDEQLATIGEESRYFMQPIGLSFIYIILHHFISFSCDIHVSHLHGELNQSSSTLLGPTMGWVTSIIDHNKISIYFISGRFINYEYKDS